MEVRIYEKENPGWIVVGGINGDFFWITDNCEIQGTSMQEGDFYKPYDYNLVNISSEPETLSTILYNSVITKIYLYLI